MCGISGIFLRPGEEAQEKDLKRMAQAMSRRGPDAEGVFVSGAVGLAHRRLKIIDLSDKANQPMLNEARTIGLAFNGEIYNFRALRSELEKLGALFRTRSDTEVILRAYEHWGVECLERLSGMFALAIWDGKDPESPKLLLARDRFGIKPLFYAENNGCFAFASELKPLMELSWLPKRVDPESVSLLLTFSHVPTPRSILEGVFQLRPGHWLRIEKGEATEGSFIEGRPKSGASAGERSEEEWLRLLDERISQAVDRQRVSDVPVGCFLSGGIDSSLIAIAYSELGDRGIETFSVGYAVNDFDETPFARTVAQAVGTQHHELFLRAQDMVGLIPEVPIFFDQPLGDPSLLSTLLLARMARSRVSVALSGDGGDELFFGYPHQRILLGLKSLGTWVPRRGIRQAERVMETLQMLGLRSPNLGRLRKACEVFQFADPAEAYESWIGVIGPLRRERIFRLLSAPLPHRQEEPWLAPLLASLSHLPEEERISEVFQRTFLLDTVLAKTDRATMAYGLEGRVPLLDDRVAQFSSELPFELKLRGGQIATTSSGKYLLRRLLAKKLKARGVGPELSLRPKKGFSIPLGSWLKTDLKYLLDEYLNPARLKREGFFESAEVKLCIDEHLSGSVDRSHLLWTLLSFQLWRERYFG